MPRGPRTDVEVRPLLSIGKPARASAEHSLESVAQGVEDSWAPGKRGRRGTMSWPSGEASERRMATLGRQHVATRTQA